MFQRLIEFLQLTTNRQYIFEQTGKEISNDELNERIYFAANYLLILRAQGRITDENLKQLSNLVINEFIGHLSYEILQNKNSKCV